MRAFALLAILLLSPPAEAGFAGLCRNWFASFGPGQKQLSLEEREPWLKAFGPHGTHPYLSEANLTHPDLFFEAWLKLPEPIRYRLLHLPPGKSPYKASEEMVPDLFTRSFLDQILKKIDREGAPKLEKEFQEYLAKRQEANFAQVREEELFRAMGNALSRAEFDSRAGEVMLPISEASGKLFLHVGPARYPARREGNSLILDVPREKVAHPFWNPVAPEKVMKMAGAGVKPPKTYETLLGHDGKFYLVDGNHRFDLDPKKTISVTLAGPHTVNLRAMLDLIGAPQPESAELITRYVQGEISWRELVPARWQTSFVLEPKPSL
ncbi:MAG: hypothetical protein EOP11_16480 [Proteobacteria bacterium]|nr:MAG: hypothetical protein EOP11_16480 [Pseudomonadota bacterium]